MWQVRSHIIGQRSHRIHSNLFLWTQLNTFASYHVWIVFCNDESDALFSSPCLVFYHTRSFFLARIMSVALKSLLRPAMLSKTRTFVTRSLPRRSGDDPHLVWNTQRKRFGRPLSLLFCFGVPIAAASVPILAIKFQNKKHGFPQK